ncbi:Site-specific DNA recombinase [Desulfotomaculum arcticum]|uniref:Site-specific DNA recombinase n=1 Tax=Desulfotruncus arcticus DSM 17038 TaxID=1121424 RepID=A0A1I2TCN2_9FIRM|nr:recombinase family protein [Desulfotruncus arcticus]SFG62774.1 Site-specific DNA recombinase [Desulfotomaculum arcticum] [Desulfotruncus arcticus DSM 17038]
MKAVIYARFSSDNQREESLTAQIRACTDYADKRGYTIIQTYTDEARSALTDNRPGFLRMIDEIKNFKVKADLVLVHKLDRFARNRYDSAFYRRELRQAGVRLESVTERLDDSPEAVLLESLIEGIAEYYSKNLAREVMKGMRETALQAKHCGGTPPLGYNVGPDKKYIINETEARAVRIIFNMYAAGHGYGNIITTLNETNYKTKAGKPFGKNSLHEILKNKKYAGIYVFNRSTSKNATGRRNNH